MPVVSNYPPSHITMDPKLQASFIPKETLSSGNSFNTSGVSILLLAATIIFLSTLGAAGGVYLWQRSLTKGLADTEESLARAKKSLEPALIVELTRLNGRIESAKELLGKHIAPSLIFSLLGDTTLTGVSFKDFSYIIEPPRGAKISMKGVARSFNALAVLSDQFLKNSSLTNPVISNFDLDKDGNVSFDFSSYVKSSYPLYVNKFVNTPEAAGASAGEGGDGERQGGNQSIP